MITGNIKIKDLVTGEIYKQPMHSFVNNFLYILSHMLGFTTTFPIKTSGNTMPDPDEAAWSYFRVNASANNNSYGIVIGEGETAESCDQYALTTILDLTEEVCHVDAVALDGQIAKCDIHRVFVNETGGAETINEIAMYFNIRNWKVSYPQYQNNYLMGIRDLLDSGVAIADGVSKKVTYTLSVTSGLTKNFMLTLMGYFDSTGKTVVDTDGDNRTSGYSTFPCSECNAAEDTKDYGIVIGTDDTAIDIEDYQLGTQLITDWKHYKMRRYLTETDTGTGITRIGFSREFTNDTGSSVTVNEIGLVAFGTGSGQRFLFARYLTGGITDASGQTLLIRLKFKTTM